MNIMPDNDSIWPRVIRTVFFLTLFVMCTWGLLCVVAEIRPFWIDEWRIIYNLKYRNNTTIWGSLAFMQQFPRTYLYIIKQLAHHYNYCYQSLRVIPYIAGLATVIYLQLLSRKVSTNPLLQYIFVLMLLSSGTFTQYFVEIKQYTMELLLSVAAVGQLAYLLSLGNNEKTHPATYASFCLFMAIAPFFSYTYPIVIAPVYIVILTNMAINALNGQKTAYPTLVKQWVPIFLSIFGITVFYAIDVAHVAADNDMHKYWQHLMGGTAPIYLLPERIFHFMAQSGSGFVFWWLFGICGIVSLVVVTRKTVHHLRIKLMLNEHYLNLYGLLTILLIIALNIAGKLPLGEPRLNAFGIPAIALLVTAMLQQAGIKYKKATMVLSIVLLAGLAGNIYTTIIASFTDDKYSKRMAIYRATERAIILAQKKGIPILVTPGVAWPYDHTQNYPFEGEVPGDWVLMTWPAYPAQNGVAVYAIPTIDEVQEYSKRLPANVKEAIAGDGLKYTIYPVASQ